MAAASSILRDSQHQKKDSFSEHKSYWIGQNVQYLERRKRHTHIHRERDTHIHTQIETEKETERDRERGGAVW